MNEPVVVVQRQAIGVVVVSSADAAMPSTLRDMVTVVHEAVKGMCQ
tara:strand:+ start:2342 stop:2479 length:138 start_codon:yes stop_codon:yes gene_type:complete